NDRQLGGRDQGGGDAPGRPHRPGAGHEDGHLTPVPGEHLVGVGAARRTAGRGAAGGQRGPQLAERALRQAADSAASTTSVMAAAVTAGTVRRSTSAGASLLGVPPVARAASRSRRAATAAWV